ncbi:hypothetical protein SAMD00019534_080720 [Acytostelium subglobosum LB1]|uniref:hypothetical protein n=1 Tax=Acytostelium subglobosum LB1 TaxID=1410327 RepID=UPI0006449F7C|nr:hypothetical protein SAMD00019534_080720 [Acytostelium subglobosum LB1]GAM24897.1 hypothetical protein SAMD00019534_080720 [Acytostelium subglobosum LB1]|eukprot:XP_012751986.1 hypothetical protein SAMD00019534_080720 [Acytostelium subglobosum LB1]
MTIPVNPDLSNLRINDSANTYHQPEAHIAAWATAVPLPIQTEHFLEKCREDRVRDGWTDAQVTMFETFVKSSNIKQRHTVHPFLLPKDVSAEDYPEAVGVMPYDIFADGANPTMAQREACFEHTAVKLAVASAQRALKKWGKDKSNITHIITTCTSGWREPGIACAVIKELGLSEDICKQELNYNGCFCGASCLRLARDIVRGGLSGAVLVVACEVATTQYNTTHSDMELMVAQTLFADGSASIIVDREGEWMYTKTGGAVVPDSQHLLGLRPALDGESSYCMTLSKNVASALYQYFATGNGRNIINRLWKEEDGERPALAIHPGGPRILEAVGKNFNALGWKSDALEYSYDTLRNYGNLGCTALLFVLADRLEKQNIQEDKLITMAFGPGVTVEYSMLQRKSSVVKK